jgi:thiol-disulfide isomerase/thioredoxin
MLRFIMLVLLVSMGCSLLAQVHRVWLGDPCNMEPPGSHVSVASNQPSHPLKLPDIDASRASFYVMDQSILVLHGDVADTLWIDRNNNHDLTDDGPPLLFPALQNTIAFWMVSKAQDTLWYRFLRKPEVPDSTLSRDFDSDGNLRGFVLTFWSSVSPGFTGKRGTYYFSEFLNCRRGTLCVGKDSIDVGILIAGGAASSSSTHLLVDFDRDHKFYPPTEELSHNNVFQVRNKRFFIDAIDTGGRWMEFRETKRPVSSKLIERTYPTSSSAKDTLVVNSRFWDLVATTMSGTRVNIREYRGKLLLLSFWSETCVPCIKQLPDIAEAHRSLGEKGLSVVGFMDIYDQARARTLIKSRNVIWPQIVLTPEVKEMFGIVAYPTDILVLPDGKRALRLYHVDTTELERVLLRFPPNPRLYLTPRGGL